MSIIHFPHLNGELKFLQFHVLDVDKILKNIFFLFIVPYLRPNIDIKFLKIILSTDQSTHLPQILNIIDDYSTI